MFFGIGVPLCKVRQDLVTDERIFIFLFASAVRDSVTVQQGLQSYLAGT